MGISGLKTKIAILWVSMSVADLLSSIIRKSMNVSLPAYFESMSNFEDIFWVLFPLLMVVLTLYLKDAGSRWTNVIVGIITILSTAGYAIILIMTKSAPMIIISLSSLILGVLITVLALRWPKYNQI